MKKLTVILAAVVLIAAILIGVFVNQKNQAITEKNQANTELAAAQTELENAATQLNDAKVANEELTAKLEAETAEKGQASFGLEEALKAKADLEEQVKQLAADAEKAATKLDALNKELEAVKVEKDQAGSALEEALKAKADLKEQAKAAAADLDALKKDLEAAKAQTPDYKYGMGMVTQVVSETDAVQVSTTVCSLTLDAEGKIVTVAWDAQQTVIQGSDIKVVKSEAIGEDLAELAKGKTVEEASASLTAGDLLESLQKAAENAK
ncbi:MAG: hypothetical protein QM308_02015 [Bacillota bacterium]|nr:hypothetical protein [Bacillota bacterium]